MGNHTHMNVTRKGSIDIGDGTFNGVLCVPHLTNNLLSIYQITHGSTRKIVEFTPNFIIIRELGTRAIIATRMVDHASWLYSFLEFVPIDGFDSFDDDHTSSVYSSIEENFDYLNFGVLTYYLVLEPYVLSPPIDTMPTISLDDACVTTILASCDSV